MRDAAKKDGINLVFLSGYRSIKSTERYFLFFKIYEKADCC